MKQDLLQRIHEWQEDDRQGYDVVIGLICEAKTHIQALRAALRDLIDAIPEETLKSDPPLEAWCQCAEAAMRGER